MGSFSNSAFDTDAFDTDSWDFGVIPSGASSFSEGTLVVSGEVQIKIVANNYTPVSTDVYILGTLHDSDGAMYVTEGNIITGWSIINSIRHTENGVRYVIIDEASGYVNGAFFISKGFLVDGNGRQYCRTSATSSFYEHGILRDDDSPHPCEMLVNSV